MLRNIITITLFTLTLLGCSENFPKEIRTKAYGFCENRLGLKSLKKENELFKVTCNNKVYQKVYINKPLVLFKKGECLKFPSRIPFLNKETLRFTSIVSPEIEIISVDDSYYNVKLLQIKKEQKILISDLSNQWRVKNCK